MGAWDATSFGNDTACDWAYELEGCNDLKLVEATLQEVLDTGDEYLDSDESVQAIAAAEVVAWLGGHPPVVGPYTEGVARWVAAHPARPPAELIQKAIAALDRIQTEPSELPGLWENDPEWIDAMADLRSRLSV